MAPEPDLVFPPFRLDLRNEQVWCGTHLVPLRPRAFAVLRYLAQHAQRLVTRAEVLQAVWADAAVSEGLLRSYIRELRAVLGDEARSPRFIETVTRRGWRFLAPVTLADPAVTMALAASPPPPISFSPPPLLVGRQAELGQLHGWLEQALQGERQMVLVTGEPGIGKTAVVEAFLAQAVRRHTVWMAPGQCVEHYGAGEAYLPVLEALGRLCRLPEEEQLRRLLHRHAPTWLVQMPALLDEAELETLQRRVQGATQERMVREMAEAVEALAAERPLVLWLEDLHWSDYSTLDLLSVLARRREPARLLVLGTYRPADVMASGHPLRALTQELQAHGQCTELPLRLLPVAAVTRYLAARFAIRAQDAAPMQALGRRLHQHTGGNPLFMVTMADALVAQGLLEEVAGEWQVRVRPEDIVASVPDSLRQLIERQLEQLATEAQQILEVASVVGAEFAAVAVAAGLRVEDERVEACCEALARRGQFLRAQSTERLPDGTLTGRYGFLHALHQQVLYERLGATRRMRLHRRIGEAGEVLYGAHVGDLAAELAMHFERGQEYRRAVHYLEQAAHHALQRAANREAMAHLNKGLALLQALPETPERTHQELMLQVTLGAPLLMMQGYTAPAVQGVYDRARALCRQVGDSPQLFPALFGLFRFYFLRGEVAVAGELGEQLLRLARSAPDALLLPAAHAALGATLFYRGEFSAAGAQVAQGIAVYDRQRHGPLLVQHGDDPGIVCLDHASLSQQVLGYPAQALISSRAAFTLAQELSHPFMLAATLVTSAFFHQLRRQGEAVRERAERAVTLITEQELSPYWLATATILLGWALAMRGQTDAGLAQLRQGLDLYRSLGVEQLRSWALALMAEACIRGGQADAGRTCLAEALAAGQATGLRFYEAELYRLKGELLLQGAGAAPPAAWRQHEAEACLQQAIAVAQRQQARFFELRTTVSLCRLWQRQGKQAQARQRLAEIYGWFTEGFDTPDVQDASALLAALR